MQTFISQHDENDVIDRLHELFGETDHTALAEVYNATTQNGEKLIHVATSEAELVSVFSKLNSEEHIVKHSLPNTFTAPNNDTIDWLYQPATYTWTNLQRLVELPEVQSATLFVPMAWQLGSLFYDHCRSVQVVTSIFDGAGFSSVELLLKNYPVDLLVTSSDGLRQCIESNITLPDHVLVIMPWGQVPWLLAPEKTNVVYEIHLFPGFPIAEAKQIPTDGSFPFLPTTEHLFTTEGNTLFVSSIGPTPVPFLHYQLDSNITLSPNQTGGRQLQYG